MNAERSHVADESARPGAGRQQIAFASNRGGPFNSEVYVMNANGSGQSRLTTNPRSIFSPQW